MSTVLGEWHVTEKSVPVELYQLPRLLGAREAGSGRAVELRAVRPHEVERPGRLGIGELDEAAEGDALEVFRLAAPQGPQIDVVGLGIDGTRTIVGQALRVAGGAAGNPVLVAVGALGSGAEDARVLGRLQPHLEGRGPAAVLGR